MSNLTTTSLPVDQSQPCPQPVPIDMTLNLYLSGEIKIKVFHNPIIENGAFYELEEAGVKRLFTNKAALIEYLDYNLIDR